MRKTLTLTLFIVWNIVQAQLTAEVYRWPKANDGKNFSATLLSGSALDFSKLEVIAVSLKPNKSITIDKAFEHALFILSGSLSVTMNDSTWHAAKGSVVVIMPGEKVLLKNNGKDFCTYHDMRYQSKIETSKKDSRSFVREFNSVTFKPHERGGVRSFFDRETAMTTRFEVHMTTLNANVSSHDPHTHRDEEIIMILDGNVEMLVGDKVFKAGPGDFIFVPTELRHGLKNIGQVSCSYFAYQWR